MCLLKGGLLAGDNGAYMNTNKLRDTPTGASDDLWECPFSYLLRFLSSFSFRVEQLDSWGSFCEEVVHVLGNAQLSCHHPVVTEE